MTQEKKQAVVLYSGGLDSRLAVHMLQDQGFEVTALYFNLPFGCGCCNISCNFNFTQESGVNMKIIDVTKEELLREYLTIIKDPKHGRGTALNPCKDCKIFIFRKAKEYADKHGIKVIASGEVLGQRPMSQTISAKKIIDEALGFEILRPLSAKLLPETSYERQGLIDRSKLHNFQGRSRTKQMELAKHYEMKYPSPGGGCLLCEKAVSNRLSVLLKKRLINENTLPLTMIGRHFIVEDTWMVVARNAEECKIIDTYNETLIGEAGKPSVYVSKNSGKKQALLLQEAYKSGTSEKDRGAFKEYKL